MAYTPIPVYGGTTPQRTQTPTEFSNNADDWLDYQAPLAENYNTLAGEVNAMADRAEAADVDVAANTQIVLDAQTDVTAKAQQVSDDADQVAQQVISNAEQLVQQQTDFDEQYDSNQARADQQYDDINAQYVARFVGNYETDPTLENVFDYTIFNGVAYLSNTHPYTVDSATYPDPSSDPNLLPFPSMHNALLGRDDPDAHPWAAISDSDLNAIARSLNISSEKVSYLITGPILGCEYFFDIESAKIYATSSVISGNVDSIGENIGGVITISLDGNSVNLAEKIEKNHSGIYEAISYSHLISYPLMVGEKISLDGIIYTCVSSNRNSSTYYENLENGFFLKPSNDEPLRLGGNELLFTLPDPSFSTIGMQCALYDTRTNSIFVSYRIDTNPETCRVIQYDYETKEILATSDPLNMGHGDFLALDSNDDGIRLWFPRTLVGTYSGPFDIAYVEWSDGVSSVDEIVITTGWPSGFVTITNFNDDSILATLPDSNDSIILKFSDMISNGNISIYEEYKFRSPKRMLQTNGGQGFQKTANGWMVLSGVYSRPDFNDGSLLSLIDDDGVIGISQDIIGMGAVYNEPESIFKRWDIVNSRYDWIYVCITGTGGACQFFKANNTNDEYPLELSPGRFNDININNTNNPYFNNQTPAMEGQKAVALKEVFIGVPTQTYGSTGWSYGDFALYQVTGSGDNDQIARMQAYGVSSPINPINLDLIGHGSNNLSYGFRFNTTERQGGFTPRWGFVSGYYPDKTLFPESIYDSLGFFAVGSSTNIGFLTEPNVVNGFVSQCSVGLDFGSVNGQGILFGTMSEDGSSSTGWFNMNSSSFYPATTNSFQCGVASRVWSGGFTQTAFTVTSDRNYKQDIEDISDDVLLAWENVNFVQYRLKDRVVKKGDNARVHFGVIAQDIKKAFEEQNLDPFRYGLLCFDEWEEGGVIKQKYGVVYEEALILECALMRKKIKSLSI